MKHQESTARENVGIRRRRRQDLIEAAITTIAQHGYSGTTVSRVAKQAGVSVGLISFHFAGKSQLFEAVFDQLSEEFNGNSREAISSPQDPLEDAIAIVHSFFDETVFTPAKLAVWFTFWSDANLRDQYRARSRRDEDRIASTFIALLGGFIASELGTSKISGEELARDVFIPLNAMIDGFWLQAILYPSHMNVEKARRDCQSFLLQRLAELGIEVRRPNGDTR